MRPSSTVSPPVTAIRHAFSAARISSVRAPPPAAGAAAESVPGVMAAVAESARAESVRAASRPEEQPIMPTDIAPQSSAKVNRPCMEHLGNGVVEARRPLCGRARCRSANVRMHDLDHEPRRCSTLDELAALSDADEPSAGDTCTPLACSTLGSYEAAGATLEGGGTGRRAARVHVVERRSTAHPGAELNSEGHERATHRQSANAAG